MVAGAEKSRFGYSFDSIPFKMNFPFSLDIQIFEVSIKSNCIYSLSILRMISSKYLDSIIIEPEDSMIRLYLSFLI